jgi:serine/threonine-protein kinase
MERLRTTVGDQIARGPMPQAAVRSMLDEVLAALVVAHGAGITATLNPAIFCSAQTATRSYRLGIANRRVSHLTGQIVGTLAYLSPDRLAGKPATIADDLYAVGCVGYEPPAADRSLRKLREDWPAPSWTTHRPLSPRCDGRRPTLAAVIERAMARDRSGASPTLRPCGRHCGPTPFTRRPHRCARPP